MGHFECLKYLLENGSECDDNIGEYAAKNGHFECLKYSVEKRGMPTWTFGSRFGSLECLRKKEKRRGEKRGEKEGKDKESTKSKG